jgi:hypothetical protein
MKTLQRDQTQSAGHGGRGGGARASRADALIWEARRRQRRRRLAVGLTAVAVLATALVAVAGHHVNGPHRPAAPDRTGSRPAPARPLLPGVNAAVVMWPSEGPESWMSGAYVDGLGTGHVAVRDLPGIYGCDCFPYVIGTGRQVVYVAWGGVAAVPAGLTGKPRWLGPDGAFAPAATPGHIWKYASGHPDHPTVRLVAVTGGRPGPAVTLPRGTQLLAGTKAGLLLDAPAGHGQTDLALWRPGTAPRTLPHSAAYRWAGADARLVAYATGCRIPVTAKKARLVPGQGYFLCRTLRVFNVVTGELTSFPAPVGTAGWAPDYIFVSATAISPADTMIAAYAKLPPLRQGRVRLYVLRLTGSRHRVRAVPSSVQGLLGATMAWTPDSAWLLYQGPGEHLWAYHPATGKVRTSRTRCCQYIGMFAFPTRPG